MKTIRITYSRINDTLEHFISEYFRLTGIYVNERYICQDKYVNLQKNMDELSGDYPKISCQENTFEYDAEIFLALQESELAAGKEFIDATGKMVFVISHNLVCELKELFKNKPEYKKAYVVYDSSISLLEDLLNLMKNRQIVSESEYDDLALVKEVYVGENYFKTLIGSKYFFNADWLFEQKCKEYCGDIEKVIALLKQKGLKQWGDMRYCHTQYAAATMIYDLNLYCRRNSKNFIYNIDSLIIIIRALDNNCSGYFGNYTKCLLGQVYYDLLDKANTAYDYYLQCCHNNEGKYNAYLFKVKGIYWQNYIGDYERANKYYYKSILIFPQYFEAWYKMGYCYYQMNQKRKALLSFGSVIDILERRWHNKDYNMLTPKEIEHLFLSYRQCAGIIYELDADVEKAIEYDTKAEKVWCSISDNKYLEIIGVDMENLRYEIKRNLNIIKVYEHLAKMYKINNQYNEAEWYEHMAKSVNFPYKNL